VFIHHIFIARNQHQTEKIGEGKVGTITVKATFDGSNFKLFDPVDIKPNTSCLLTIEVIEEETYEDPFRYLLEHAGTIGGPADWSAEHDHYLYGTPKERAGNE
jgi:hypothetical protein